MSFKQHVVNIDSKSYVINPFTFVEGKRIEAQLIKYLSPIVATMMAAGAGADIDVDSITSKDLDFSEKLISAFHEMFTVHPVDDIVKFQCDILSKVQKDGRTIDLDKEFACEYDKAFELMKEVVMFNFKSVFQKLGIIAL